jgi:hypothetical protein
MGGELGMGCCSTFERAAEQQFNAKKAADELKRYRAKGPGPTTRLLVEGIVKSGVMSGTVLDVGSGIGSLTFTLLERGATGAITVDASIAYLQRAQEEAEQRGCAAAVRFVHADFVESASRMSSVGSHEIRSGPTCIQSSRWRHQSREPGSDYAVASKPGCGPLTSMCGNPVAADRTRTRTVSRRNDSANSGSE